MQNILSSDELIDLTEGYIKNLIELFISKAYEFSIITKPKAVKLEPDIPNLFPNANEYVKFDLIGYSFETSKVVDSRLVFRAGFGSGVNIKESEVSLDLIDIFQISIDENRTIFINFAEVPKNRVKKEETIKDRSKLFINKNRNLFNKS